MEKLTNTESYHFGENKIIILPYYLYEVSIYKITNDTVNIINSKYYKSNKLLKTNKEIEYRKFRNYLLVRYIDLLGAPINFIKENNLQIIKKK